MKQIGAFEAKNTLGSLLDLVEKGEEVVITRRGRRVARLVPDARGFDRDAARRAASEILANSKGVRLGDVSIRDLIDEGRP